MPGSTSLHRSSGFTIIEMMMSVALVATLSAIAVPSLGEFAKNASMRGQALELVSSISLARTEALKRGSRVILCRSGDPEAAAPACGGNDRDWSTGWLVFAVEDADNDFDIGTDILLDIGLPAPPQVSVRSNGSGNNYLVFNADGTLDESSAVRYAVCDDRGEGFGREVQIGLVGRPGLEQGTQDDPIADCTPAG
ncbi:MAG: GspH/FimT family pseudopilin [Gammaproteobacteria bacterium]